MGRQRDLRILMAGLGSAGKTSILRRLKLGPVVDASPIAGIQVEMITCRRHLTSSLSFTALSVGGVDSPTSPLVEHYAPLVNALIFVVDSNDREHVRHAKVALECMLERAEFRDLPLLVLANKQDLPSAMTVPEVAKRLGLNSLWRKRWLIQGTSAKSGEGLQEGLDWFTREQDRIQRDCEEVEDDCRTMSCGTVGLTPTAADFAGKLKPCMMRTDSQDTETTVDSDSDSEDSDSSMDDDCVTSSFWDLHKVVYNKSETSLQSRPEQSQRFLTAL